MLSAFNKEIVRSIKDSAGRFIAIAIISLLGAGFYAGLRMASPDMRIAGDDFFDGAHLYDVSVMSSMGLDEGSIKLLSDIEGVQHVMPAYYTDELVILNDGSHAAAVESLPVQAARESTVAGESTVESEDDSYLNRPILVEGAWPEDAGECVVSVFAAQSLGIKVGDTLQMETPASKDGDTDAKSEDGDAKDEGNGSQDKDAAEGEDADSKDGDKAKDDEDEDDEVEALVVRSFTVTGLVNSAAYASSSMLGVTSLGTGDIELYMYVPESAFDKDYPYSYAYLEVADAHDAQWGSAAYTKAVNETFERVSACAQEVADERYQTIVDKAQKELDDARADYEKERADVEAELSDAERELANARSQLDNAAAQLVSGRSKVDSAASQIEESEQQLKAGEAEYAAGKAQLDANRAAYEQQAAGLDNMKAQRAQVEAGIEQAQSGLAVLEERLKQAIAAGDKELEAGIREQMAAVNAQIAELQSQLQQLDGGIAAIESAGAQIAAAEAELAAARAQLDSGWSQLGQGRKKYLNGLSEYQSGYAEYLQGESSYASGWADYEEGKKEAEEGFAEAEAKLADAQADIDDLEHPDVYVLDRGKNAGVASLDSDADGMGQIAAFLPFMFFLVAALVSLTSMTRMVDEERMAIGTHKALGYRKGRIMSKYLVYGVLASGVGSVIGVVLLGKLLPWFVLSSYQVMYAFPEAPLPIDPVISAKAIGLTVGITALATLGAAYASLREKPAALMLPRAPKPGKRIFLEHIKPLWQRMSFSQKVTARNLLRYKRRFFMAVVGIAGCTALLMIGFGLRDAIGGIVFNQYEVLVGYDMEVRMADDISDENRARVQKVLDSDSIDGTLAIDDFNLIAQGADDDIRIFTVVPQDVDALYDFVTLRDRTSATPLELQDDQVIVTEKAANVMGVHAGGTIGLFDEDMVGDPTGEERVFQVGGVAENYLGHYVYMTPEGYRNAFGEDPEFDTLYVKLAEGADEASLSSELLSIDGVDTVSFVAKKITTYEDMLDIMNKLIYVIMLFSAALAFVVLYNLTNININERVREIATLKVLGFTRGEVNAYVFREIIVMAIIGALVGCVVGVPFTLYIAQAAETANMMFGRTIEPLSFVLSFVITLLFAVLVAMTMRHKLARVNMVESLKSVE